MLVTILQHAWLLLPLFAFRHHILDLNADVLSSVGLWMLDLEIQVQHIVVHV